MKIKIFAGIFLLGLSLFLTRATVRAAEDYSQDMAGMTEDILEQFDFEEIDEELKELFPEQRVGFKETIMEILSGDIMFTSDLLKRLVIEQLTYAIKSCRQNLVHILFLAVMAAVFANFGSIFQSRQISEVSFFVLYLLMIALCLNSFKSVVEWTTGGIESLTSFMKVFSPVYFLAVTIAKGSITAAAFYNLALFLILVVELLIVKLLLPLVHEIGRAHV